jgi:hypothetical protein
VPNAVLERLEAQRAEQITFIDNLLARVESEGRDLVDAETANLTAARDRMGELDAQIAPLREFENLRGDSAASAAHVFGGRGEPDQARPLGHGGAARFAYTSPGGYLADHMRARGNRFHNIPGDPNALARLQAAVENQTTADTPGLLPTPLVGPVVNTIDASRPFITSIGALPLPDAGGGFIRPKITQHVDAGLQVGEKTQLPSRKMIISQVPFSKKTFGGTVDISRQDIDWTSPAAWDAVVQDLADVYGAECEMATSADFASLVTQVVGPPATDDLAGWAAVLYEAAEKCVLGGAVPGAIPMGRLPDRIWVSLDMWSKLGPIVDVAKLVFAPGADGTAGRSSLATFEGNIFELPRIVVWGFPAGTVILGSSSLYEFRETTIGLLTAVEPSILGVEVAYGGYAAYGMLEPKAYCKVTPPAGGVTTTRSTSKSTAS